MKVLTYDNDGKIVELQFGSAVVPPQGQNDLNTNTGTLVLFSAPTFNTIGLTVNGAGDGFSLPDGRYSFTWQPSLTGTTARGRVTFEFRLNGGLSWRRDGAVYVRNSSGGNESGDAVIHDMTLVSTDEVSIHGARQASNGVLTLVAANSQLIVRKIA